MGIYDREYYRDESDGSSAFLRTNPAIKSLMAATIAVFLVVTFSAGDWVVLGLNANPEDVFGRWQVWRLLTDGFLHARQDVLGILVNMLLLFFLGRELEDRYGSREFAAFYLVSILLCSLAWVFSQNVGAPAVPVRPLGSTGAVLAVLALYALLFPDREVLFFFIIRMRIWLLAVILIGWEMFVAYGQARFSGVAHIGTGVAFAALYKSLDLRLTGFRARWPWPIGRRLRPKLRVVRPEKVPQQERRPPRPAARSGGAASTRPVPTVIYHEEQLDERLDQILAKIAREGRSGLTEEENRILQEASRRARDRREERR